MRICLISEEYPPETGWGGIGTYNFHLASEFCRRGHEVHVVAGALKRSRTYSDNGVQVHRIRNALPVRVAARIVAPHLSNSLHRLGRALSVWRVASALDRDAHFDAVESPLWGGEAVLFIRHKRRDLPVFVRFNTPFAHYWQVVGRRPGKDALWASWMEADVARRAEYLLPTTHAIGQEVSTCYRISPTRYRIAPLGVPLPAASRLKAFDPSSRNVVFLGRLESRKGTAALIRAIEKVVQHVPDAYFHLIGRDVAEAPGGLLHTQYARQVLSAGALAQVKFHGFLPQTEVDTYLANCAVFCAPSVYESFGLIWIEAMAWGKPIVACLAGSAPEIILNGETGILGPVDDSAALADAIIRLLTDRTLRERMGEAARNRAVECFSVERMTSITEALYAQGMVGDPKSGRAGH